MTKELEDARATVLDEMAKHEPKSVEWLRLNEKLRTIDMRILAYQRDHGSLPNK